MTHEESRRSLRIFVTGFRLSIGDLCDALARQPGIEFIGAAGRIGEASWALRAGEVDVVVHAMVDGGLPRGDLTEIREYTRAPIVLLTEAAEPALFEAALDADVADVVILPEPAERLAFTVRKAARTAFRQEAAMERTQARVITIFSPKGGTGKTVVSTNLATSIAKYDGRRTLLLDLDLQFGDAAIMLGIEPEQTLHDLVTAPGELDADKFRGYLTHHAASGVDVLAAPLRPEDGELVTDEKVERLLEVARPIYDVIVVDTSPFFHGPMLSTLDHTDELCLVCSPEVPTLKNVRLGIETLRLLSFPEERMRLVLNRADADVGMRRPEVEGALGVSVDFELPSVQDVPAAVNRGTPLTLSSPSIPFSVAVRNMSNALLGRKDGLAQPPAGAPEAQPSRRPLASTVRHLAVGWLSSREDKQSAGTAEEPA
jgi:pilus assembly protein CpaE